MKNPLNNLTLVLAAVAITVGTTNAFGQNLWMIDPWDTETASEGRTVVYDNVSGRVLVVGRSGTATGIFWDSTLGTSRLISTDGALAQQGTGLGIRPTPLGSQLVAHGLTSSGHTLFTSNDGGLTWARQRFTNTYQPYNIGTANTLGVSPTVDGDGTAKIYYGFPWGAGSSRQITMVTGTDGAGPNYYATLTTVNASTTSDAGALRGVSGTSATGVALGVGNRGANAYWVNAPGAKGTINTLNGTVGEAWAISNDGLKIFGRSTNVTSGAGLYPFMNTGFVAGSSGGTAVELPGLPGAVNYAGNGAVYGASQDGRYAVGMSYPGQETAVLWDTVANTILDLDQYASDNGLLDGFTRLSRAYSVYDENYAAGGQLFITGLGNWSDGVNNYTRGWVMAIPEPSTLALAGLGLASLLIFRRRR